ncbi:folylpolyglutamate synthase/dihydrofolate synthase [Lachnospiraceae bacterium JC7]|nr:folylpolyglutamate synthase/dihydrofolate synthase [Lachnospiraceae bacterium JC7]
MDWNEAIALFHGADWKHAKIGLDRMKDLMKVLGDPQKNLKFIHIAGTNGKGSACSMTASVLTAAGYRTGLYVSPHLDAFNERISIDGVYVSDEDLRRIAAKINAAISTLNEEPTDFELITALSLCYFAEQNCDFVVLEVGMGGRLDATNVIDAPVAAAIMSIGLDHTEVLGDTEELIAGEKAGIIKKGSDVVVLHQKPSVLEVIAEKFRRVNSEHTASHFCITDPSSLSVHSRDLSGQVFDYKNFRDIKLPLLGAYQTENAAAVLEIITCLKARGYMISDEDVRTGLLNAKWPGRFELLSTEPVLIVDGAHNPDGVMALINSIRTFLPHEKICFVMGVMKDKDYHEMLRLITPFAESFVTELPYSARGLDPEVLKKEISAYFSGPVDTAGSVTEAVNKALAHAKETNTPVICFGSLYQVADIRKHVMNSMV